MLDIFPKEDVHSILLPIYGGEEAFICLVPHEAIVSLYLHVYAICMQNNLMKITTTLRLHLLQQFKICSARFPRWRSPRSPSNYLIILMHMRFRVKIGVQGSSQKESKKKRKERTRIRNLISISSLHTQNDNPRFFCCASSKSCEISLH